MSVARYTHEQAKDLINIYRRLFPLKSAHWPTLKAYWDFQRMRPWSCITTNFHEVSFDRLLAFDAARRSWRRSDRHAEDGAALAALASNFDCGYSLGLSPWTDSALHATVTNETRTLVALVGHDWYPIVPKRGPVEARPPLDIFQLIGAEDPQWRRYADGIPTSEAFHRAGVGLLFLNLVPDFRHPDAAAEKEFPFPPGYGYQDCLSGLLAALESAHAYLPIQKVITWGSPAWEAVRELVVGPGSRMSVTEAAHTGGGGGFKFRSERYPWRIHAFPHPTPSKRHLLWTAQLMKIYTELWVGLCPAVT